jgi:regulator of sirC expression with transglutaminase-like and TPR domain
MTSTSLSLDLEIALASEPVDLAELALTIARLESPRFDAAVTRRELQRLGDAARLALDTLGAAPVRSRIRAVNRVLFGPDGFHGDRATYDDIRNSLLHVVMERRLGIPITLAVVYISVARRAGLDVFGVSFPGHFLLRVPSDPGSEDDRPIILDPFDRGRELTREELSLRLSEQVEDETWSDNWLAPCTSRQVAVRMLNNMKRLYVGQRSFDQAWHATDMLVALEKGDPEQIRDRGLLAYHVDRFPQALADLEAYVRMTGRANEGSEQRSQIWEHISSLRRRVAGLN